MTFHKYSNSHYKDKAVSWPSYLYTYYTGISYLERRSLRCAESCCVLFCVVYVFSHSSIVLFDYTHAFHCFSLALGLSYTFQCTKYRYFEEVLIIGCIGSCHFGKWCNQWRKFHQDDNISVSVHDYPVSVRKGYMTITNRCLTTYKTWLSANHVHNSWDVTYHLHLSVLFALSYRVCFLQEIVDDPQMFVEGASRFDVKQGELGKTSRKYAIIGHKKWTPPLDYSQCSCIVFINW